MKPYNAISNLSASGYPPGIKPTEECSFATQAEATAWLKKLGCGGSVVAHVDGDFKIVGTASRQAANQFEWRGSS